MIPYNKISHALREAWKVYWDFKDSNPIKAQTIKDIIILITKEMK